MSLVIALFIIVVLVSFICSLLEATFLSITPAYVALVVKESPRTGKLMEHLKEKIDRPISAILTLATVANAAGASAIGALVYEKYGSVAVTATSIVLAVTILIFSEIVPKIIGAIYWKSLAAFSVYTIQAMIFIVYPVVWITESISKLLGKPDAPEVTREEFIATAELGVGEGTLHAKESTIIKNLLMLNNIYVSDIMTPRSVIFALDANMTVEEVFEKYKPIRFSRIPVYEATLDNIMGMTLRHKIHETLSSDHHDVKIRDLMTSINSVPERMSVSSVIDFFVKKKEHMALAVDEYGIVTGLVTLEDAIETLLGVEIMDELDNIPDMRQYALEQWQVRKNQFRRT